MTSVQEVIDDLVNVDSRRVLDVGCGTGRLVRWLAARGCRATGLETQVDLATGARRRPPVNDEDYVAARGEYMPFDAGEFDLVVFSFSLHHVPESAMRSALAEAGRVLWSDGRVLVIEPVADGDYFEPVRLIDDETRVRALALQALRDVRAHGLVLDSERCYRNHGVYKNVEDFVERMIEVDPGRRAVIDADRARIDDRFSQYGKPDPEGYRFEMEIRASLLLKCQ